MKLGVIKATAETHLDSCQLCDCVNVSVTSVKRFLYRLCSSSVQLILLLITSSIAAIIDCSASNNECLLLHFTVTDFLADLFAFTAAISQISR